MYEHGMLDVISAASYRASYFQGTSLMSTQRTFTGRERLDRTTAKIQVTNIGRGEWQNASGICLADGRKTARHGSFPGTTSFAPVKWFNITLYQFQRPP